MKKRYEMYVYGKVQGVGFRSFVNKLSQNFNLVGNVQNLLNGSVKIICECEETDFEKFNQTLILLANKNYYISIDRIEVKMDSFKNEFSCFSIKY